MVAHASQACLEMMFVDIVAGQVNAIYAWCERRAREIGKWLKERRLLTITSHRSACSVFLWQDHPEVTAWVALDDLDFDWADSLRQAGC